MTIAKYILIISAIIVAGTIFNSAEISSAKTTSPNLENDKAYILGFEEGSEAMTNMINAELCAAKYADEGASRPGPECYTFYENYKLKVMRYHRIKKKIDALKKKKKEKKSGKDSK